MFRKSLIFAVVATIIKVLLAVAAGQLHGGAGALLGALIGSGIFFVGAFVLCLAVLAIVGLFA